MLYVGAKALEIEQMQGSSQPLPLSDAISKKNHILCFNHTQQVCCNLVTSMLFQGFRRAFMNFFFSKLFMLCIEHVLFKSLEHTYLC